MAAVPFPESNVIQKVSEAFGKKDEMALAEARKPELAAWLVTALGVCDGSGPVGAFLPDPARRPGADTQHDEHRHQSEEKLLRTTGAQLLLGRASDEPFAPSPVAKSGWLWKEGKVNGAMKRRFFVLWRAPEPEAVLPLSPHQQRQEEVAVELRGELALMKRSELGKRAQAHGITASLSHAYMFYSLKR